MIQQTKQPELVDEFGCSFYGNAKTLDGDLWWYVDTEVVSHPLMPRKADAGRKE